VYVQRNSKIEGKRNRPTNTVGKTKHRQCRGRENGIRKAPCGEARKGPELHAALSAVGTPSVALHGLLLGEPLDEGGQVPHPGAGLRDLPEHPGRRGVTELRELAARPLVGGLVQLRLEARELRRHRRGRRERRGTQRGLHSEPGRAGRV